MCGTRAPLADARGFVAGQFTKVHGESIKLVFPQPAVLVEPVRRGAHGGGQETHPTDSPFTPAFDEACPLEHNEMLADGGQRHREGTCQLADGCFPGGETRHDRAPRGIGQRTEDSIEAALGVNHMV